MSNRLCEVVVVGVVVVGVVGVVGVVEAVAFVRFFSPPSSPRNARVLVIGPGFKCTCFCWGLLVLLTVDKSVSVVVDGADTPTADASAGAASVDMVRFVNIWSVISSAQQCLVLFRQTIGQNVEKGDFAFSFVY